MLIKKMLIWKKGYLFTIQSFTLMLFLIFEAQNACNYVCSTCSTGVTTTCLTCNITKFRVYSASTLTCSCLGGYFDDGTN